MEKKELKWYSTPDVEVIETELEGQILTGSNGSNADNVGSEEPEWDD
jgi:hypothetical protein